MTNEGKEIVFITGAGGFIGGHVVERVYLEGQFIPRAGIHTWKGMARIARFPIDIVPSDIMDKGALSAAMDGVQYVVHCAVGSPEVTVEGTRNVLQAAVDHGLKRLVHLSTVEVYGDAMGVVDENTPYGYAGRTYGDSKIEAEKLCWDYHEKNGLSVIVLRPAIVYGPFSKIWTMNFAERFKSGKWRLAHRYGQGMCNLVYVDDLVSAILQGLCEPDAAGEAFNVTGPEIITWNDYFQRFNHAMGLEPLKEASPMRSKLRHFYTTPLKGLARLLKKYSRDLILRMYDRYDFVKVLMGKAEETLLSAPTSDELNLFSKDVRYVTDKAQQSLGYQPKQDVESGLQLTISWLKHHDFLAAPSIGS